VHFQESLYSVHWDNFSVRIPKGANWGPSDFQNTDSCKRTNCGQ